MYKKRIFFGARIVLVFLFIMGLILIAIYPFQNRNLKIEFNTNDGRYTVWKDREEIKNSEMFEFTFSDCNEIEIQNIKIYSNFTQLATIQMGELFGYIESADLGDVQWTENNTISITGIDSIHIIMNDSFCELLRKQSASFLQERIMLIEIWGAFIIILMMICRAIQEKIDDTSNSNHGPIYETKRFFRDIKKYSYYIIYAAKTDLKAEVANSYLNRLWWILEPFFNMLVYVIVFGQIMGNSIQNYATFIFSALLMWNYFSRVISYSVKLVRSNKDIITKVYIPKFILLLTNIVFNLFKLLFSFMVLVVMMIVFKIPINFTVLWVVPAYVVVTLLAFGIGMILLHYGVFIDDFSYAVGIILSMLMFLSGTFYDVLTTLPEPLNMIMICCNPVAMLIDVMRNALLYRTASNLMLLGIWFLISLITCCIGVHIVYKNENGYVKVV